MVQECMLVNKHWRSCNVINGVRETIAEDSMGRAYYDLLPPTVFGIQKGQRVSLDLNVDHYFYNVSPM